MLLAEISRVRPVFPIRRAMHGRRRVVSQFRGSWFGIARMHARVPTNLGYRFVFWRIYFVCPFDQSIADLAS